MDEVKINKEYRRLKNLHQYRKYDEASLKKVSYLNVIKQLADIKSLFTDPDEIKECEKSLAKYMSDYIPETVSDINILRSVIYLEIFNKKLQKKLDDFEKVDNRSIININELILKNLEKILKLKESIGMTKDKKSTERGSLEEKISLWKKQFDLWLRNNAASRYRVCPHCGQDIMLRIRMDKWDLVKHPFFKDRILHNKTLMDAYIKFINGKPVIADDNFISNVLEASPDYLKWLTDRFYKTADAKKKLRESSDRKRKKNATDT